MDILYFCLHRIIPPKGKPGILIGGKPRVNGDSHLVKTAPEVNFFYEKYK